MNRTSLPFLGLIAAACLCVAGSACRATAPPICYTTIDDYLEDSPMAGEGAHYVKWGRYFNVDPRLLVGISLAESSLGRYTCQSYNAWGWACGKYVFAPGVDPDTNRAEFAGAPGYVAGQGISFETGWEDCMFWVTRSLRQSYLDQGLTTVATIQPKYCTSGCEHWISNVSTGINALGGDVTDLDFPGEDCGIPTCNADLNNLYVQFGASSDCGSSTDPIGSLVSAITKANNGGTININNSGSAGGTLNPGGKTVTLRPTGGAITLSP